MTSALNPGAIPGDNPEGGPNMKSRSSVFLLMVLCLSVPVSAVPWTEGPASRTETFYQALRTQDLQVAADCVRQADRSALSLAAAAVQWYSQSPVASDADWSSSLHATVLSWINAEGMPVYWHEPSRYAKVLLDAGDARQFVFILEREGSAWKIRLDPEALEFMMQTRRDVKDPRSLRTSGQRTPSWQAKEFVKALGSGDYAGAREFVAPGSRGLFSLLSMFRSETGSGGPEAVAVTGQRTDGDTARVELDLGGGRRITLDLVLLQGEWLVRF